jgi:hypothetical protein
MTGKHLIFGALLTVLSFTAATPSYAQSCASPTSVACLIQEARQDFRDKKLQAFRIYARRLGRADTAAERDALRVQLRERVALMRTRSQERIRRIRTGA